MANALPLWGAVTTLTCTLTSLASDTNLLTGRLSSNANNSVTGDQALEALVGGKVTTGTGPTTARQIEIWSYASYDNVSFAGGATGTDSGYSAQNKDVFKLLTAITTNATSNATYQWGPEPVGRAYGVLPVRWGIFIVHNTGVNLNAQSSLQEVKYIPWKVQST